MEEIKILTERKIMKKRLLKIIIFILIFTILFYYIFSILWVDKTWVTYFVYEEPKNSLDIIYIGASNVYSHFNTVLAYDLYGYTTGTFSSASQPFPITKYLMEESKKYQNPILYIIDIARLAESFSDITEANIRRSTDSMKFSRNRINAINELLSYKNLKKEDYINYYFSFFIYHNAWKNITEMNFVENPSVYKGFYFEQDKNNDKTKTIAQKKNDWTTEVIELQEENKKVLIELINYIKANNINVLFVIPTRTFDKTTIGRLKYATDVIQKNRLNVINFNTLEDLKVDFATDFFNSAHLNIYGSTKYTLYFAEYLKKNYNLPNHKENDAYSSWDREYERFKQTFKELTKQEFDELLSEYI